MVPANLCQLKKAQALVGLPVKVLPAEGFHSSDCGSTSNCTRTMTVTFTFKASESGLKLDVMPAQIPDAPTLGHCGKFS